MGKEKTGNCTKGCLVIFIVVLGIIFLGSIGEDNNTNTSNNNYEDIQQNSTSDRSGAFMLASMQAGYNSPPQSLVNDFKQELSELSEKCPNEDKEEIANDIFIAKKQIKKYGGSITLLKTTKSINESIPESAIGTVSCKETAAAFVTLYTSN